MTIISQLYYNHVRRLELNKFIISVSIVIFFFDDDGDVDFVDSCSSWTCSSVTIPAPRHIAHLYLSHFLFSGGTDDDDDDDDDDDVNYNKYYSNDTFRIRAQCKILVDKV